MVTECFGSGFWEFSDTEGMFIWGVSSLLPLIIPLSICLGIWLHYYGQSSTFTGLGLDEASTTREVTTFSWPWRILYALVFTSTFLVGSLTFKVWQLTQELVAAIFE